MILNKKNLISPSYFNFILCVYYSCKCVILFWNLLQALSQSCLMAPTINIHLKKHFFTSICIIIFTSFHLFFSLRKNREDYFTDSDFILLYYLVSFVFCSCWIDTMPPYWGDFCVSNISFVLFSWPFLYAFGCWEVQSVFQVIMNFLSLGSCLHCTIITQHDYTLPSLMYSLQKGDLCFGCTVTDLQKFQLTYESLRPESYIWYT